MLICGYVDVSQNIRPIKAEPKGWKWYCKAENGHHAVLSPHGITTLSKISKYHYQEWLKSTQETTSSKARNPDLAPMKLSNA